MIDVDPQIEGPTEITTPFAAYPSGVDVVAGGPCDVLTVEGAVHVFAPEAGPVTVTLTRQRDRSTSNHHLDDLRIGGQLNPTGDGAR